MRWISPKMQLWSLLVVGVCLLGAFQKAHAQSAPLPPGLACRNCHEGSQRELTFPSGETVSIAVDLAKLDASPHTTLAEPAVACSECHSGHPRYQYPHDPDPAQTRRDFVWEVSANCKNCHYAHSPFHPVEDDGNEKGDLPACADCHGGHDVGRVEQMGDSMPAKCLACHTDQDAAWAAEFVAPRPGLGAGADGYAGSTRCNGCHDDKVATWQDTLHARLIRIPAADPAAVLGDFSADDVHLTFAQDDVAYTIGNRWRQAYLTETVSGTLSLLPAQWIVASSEWTPLTEGGKRPQDWITECGSCHVTGLNTETWGFTEFGIGCESCHGPAAAHAADPENIKPYAKVDDQVCGACHSRGMSPEGYHFPATYRPGDNLADHTTFTTDSADVWPDGSAKRNHQQYMDWTLGSPMALAAETHCTTCHAVHDKGQTEAQLHEPLNGLCLQCHNEQKALMQHTPFHQQALRSQEFSCADCHLPLMATSAVQYDLHNHSFLQPNPEATVAHGGVEILPNSCNLCHTDLAENPEWATQTVAYARSMAQQASFFGPGPTPTSPPPPTPMASVGQAPEKIEATPPFWWLRMAAFAVVGMGAVLGAAAIVNALRKRRTTNG